MMIDKPFINLYPISQAEAKTQTNIAKEYPKLGIAMCHLLAKHDQLPAMLSARIKTNDTDPVNFDGISDSTVIALHQFSERNSIATCFKVKEFLLALDQIVEKEFLTPGEIIGGSQSINLPLIQIRLTKA